MEVSIFNNQVLIKSILPGHHTRINHIGKTCPSGYAHIEKRGQYQYYIDNGGKLEYDDYKNVINILFSKIIESLFVDGNSVDFPFFGDIKIVQKRNQYYYRSKKVPHYAYGRKKYRLIFSTIEYKKTPISLYKVFFPKKKIEFYFKSKNSDKKVFIRKYFNTDLSLVVIRMQQRYKRSKFLKE